MVYVTFNNKKIRLPVDQNGIPVQNVTPNTGGTTITVQLTTDDAEPPTLIDGGKVPQSVRVVCTGGDAFIKFGSYTDFTISSCTYTDLTRIVDSTGGAAFANYTFTAGDTFKATAGTPDGAGSLDLTPVKIDSLIDEDRIVLVADLFTADDECTVAANLAGVINVKPAIVPVAGTGQEGMVLIEDQEYLFPLRAGDAYFEVIRIDAATINVYVTPVGERGTMS